MKKVDELIPYENNPRNNADAVPYVKESIKQFGFKVPIIIDKDNVIIAGHTRLLAAKELGYTEVPCIVADDLTEEQVKAFRLADNKVAEFAEWDMDKLMEEIAGIGDDFNLDDLGFGDIIQEDEEEPHDDDFDADEFVPEEPISQRGDLFLLGRHRLMCGDSTKEQDIETLVGDAQIDLLLTDPPYNVDYEGEAGKIANDDMDNDTFRKTILTPSLRFADKKMKKGASFFIWFAGKIAYWVHGAILDVGWEVKQMPIWKKNSLVLGRSHFQYIHEPCFYGWKEGAASYFIDSRTETTVFEFDRPSHNNLHPTMKPIPLWAYLLKCSSKENDNVLDLYTGSGTTIIACEQMKRNAYCMEFLPKFVDVIVYRYLREVGSAEDCYLIRDGVKQPLPEKFTQFLIEDY